MAEAVTKTFDRPGLPVIVVSRDVDGNLTAAIEVEGLEAKRALSFSEKAAGAVSLNPPTISLVNDPDDRPRMIRVFVQLGIKTVLSAVVSSGETMTPAKLTFVAARVGTALRRALTSIGEKT